MAALDIVLEYVLDRMRVKGTEIAEGALYLQGTVLAQQVKLVFLSAPTGFVALQRKHREEGTTATAGRT